MDYSNYYLKNYFKNRDGEDGGVDFRQRENIAYDAPINDSAPREDFAEPRSDVEIEVVPQITGKVHVNYELSEDDAIIDILPQSYDRHDSRRRGWIMTLTIVTCLLLTVVVGDFATGGALLAGISSHYRAQTMPKSEFYAVVLKSCAGYSEARIYSDQIRLLGGAGYIVKNGDKYDVIGDVYDDLSEANAVVDKNQGSRLTSYTVEEVDFENLFSANSQLMRSMGGYSVGIVNQLSKIGDDLTGLKIDKNNAVEQIGGIRDNLKLQFDQLQAETDSGNKNVKVLLVDINTTLGLLSNLAGDSVSRPNLICDIRYTKVQLTLNYCQMISSMAN